MLGEHARLMAAAGHDVRVVVARGEAAAAGVELVRIPLVDSLHPDVHEVQAELDAGRVPSGFATLRDRLGDELATALHDRDVVICHNVASLNKNLALTAALHDLGARSGAPRLVLWHHDLAWTLPQYRPTLHDGAPWNLLRQPWRGAVQVTISAARANELATLMGLAPGSIVVVPNGVDLATVLGLDAATLGLAAGTRLLAADPLMLMPSRILPRKAIEVGVEVVAALRASGAPAGVVVAGPADPHERGRDGYLTGLRALAVERGVAEWVWFPGADLAVGVPDAVMADLYALADLVFLPSRDEGFGIPVLEAALHRLPIVCTDLPALREVAGEAAVWLPPDASPRDIAARIRERLDTDPVARLARKVRHGAAWDVVYGTHIAPLLASIAAS